MKKKKFFFIFFSIALPLLIIIYFLPLIFSTSGGKQLLTQKLQNNLSLNQMEIGSLYLSWFGPQKMENVFLQKSDFKLKAKEILIHKSLFSLKKLSLRGLLEDKFIIEGGELEINNSSITHISSSIKQKNNTLIYKLSGKTTYQQEEGKIQLIGQEGFEETSVKVELNHFPLKLVDTVKDLFFPKLELHLQKLMGPTLDLTANCSIKSREGPVEFALSSEKSFCTFKGRINKNFLVFDSPFKCSFYLTEELFNFLKSKNYFSSINKLESVLPMEILIDPASKIPWDLNPLDLSLLSGEFHINLAKIKADVDKRFFSLLGFLETTFAKKNLELWFTPVNVSIKDHILTSDRCDFLISKNLHLCSWGKIPLDTKILDMFLGIPLDSLFDTLKLPFSPKNKVIIIPVKGKINEIKIDQKLAKNKFALLLSQTGKIGNTLSSSITGEKEKAPPAKPLPWENSGVKGLFNIFNP